MCASSVNSFKRHLD